MMNYLRRMVIWMAGTAALVFALGVVERSYSAEESKDAVVAPATPAKDATAAPADEAAPAKDASATEAAASDPFKIPDGSAAQLLAFIDSVGKPKQEFKSADDLHEYLSHAITAISAASDKILAMSDATAQQKVDAIHWKLETFRIRQQLGDSQADPEAEAFLNSLNANSSPEIAKLVKGIRFARSLRQWHTLSAAQHQQLVDEFVADLKSSEIATDQVVLLYRFADMLSDSPDSSLAAHMIEQMLPTLQKSDDPQVQRITAELAGIARRVNLPGHPIEIEGKLLDGTPVDWASYRGKVVLLDFWATDCGVCISEMPHVLEAYRLFHDKGFEVLGISLDSNRAAVQRYLQEAGIPWPTLFRENPDQPGWDHPIATKYAINAIPRMILVDQQGNVVSLNARGPKLTAELQRLLGAPTVDQDAQVGDKGGDDGYDGSQSAKLTAAPAAP
jgi:thiol-disulfide isomerase/thioredoxin